MARSNSLEPLGAEAACLAWSVPPRDQVTDVHVVVESEFVRDLVGWRRIEYRPRNRLSGTRIVWHDQPAA